MSDDLWGFGEEPNYVDSEDEARKPASDLDDSDPDMGYMLNDTKRKKLGLGAAGDRKRGRRGGSGGGGKKSAADNMVNLASDDDSDKQLLRQAGADARRSTAASLPPPPTGGATQRAGRREAALDPRAAKLLQTLHDTEARMQALQEATLSDDDSEEQPEPSPIVVHRTGRQQQARQAQQQQQQQQQQGGEVDLTADSDSGGSPGSQAAADSEVGEGSGGYAPLPAPAAAPPADVDRIPLKLRSAKGEKTLRMGRNDPFSRLFGGYRKWAAEQGHLPSADAPVRFVFDGEQLGPHETPAGLDLEGDEIIEVYL